MSLGVIPRFLVLLSDFWRESQKRAKKENWTNQAFAAAKCFTAERPKAKLGPPQLRCSVAVLRRIEALRHDEVTVHRGKNFWILFRKPHIRTPIVKDPNKLLMGVQIRIKLNKKHTVFIFGQT